MDTQTQTQTQTLTTLPALADQINAEHLAAVQAAESAIGHAMTCGRLLIEAKEQLPHGQWLPWLSANCRVKERQSRNYMRLVREWPAIQAKTAPGADLNLTIKGALKLLEVQEPEPEPDASREINSLHRQIQSGSEGFRDLMQQDPEMFRRLYETDEEVRDAADMMAYLTEHSSLPFVTPGKKWADDFVDQMQDDKVYKCFHVFRDPDTELPDGEILTVTPRKGSPGYYTTEHNKEIGTEAAHVVYDRRGISKEALRLTLMLAYHADWTEWESVDWDGENPWCVTAPGKPGKVG